MARRYSEALQLTFPNRQQSPKEAFRNIRNYLAGQFVGATRDDTLLDEVVKCLFCKLLLESELQSPLSTEVFEVAKQVRALFAKVRERFPEIYQTDDELLLDPEAIRVVMSELSFSIMDAATDPVGDAFEIFVGSESKSSAGQFFTPRSVTSLLVEALQPQLDETVLDPACGAGGFLTSVCAYLLRKGASAREIAAWASNHCIGIDKDAYLVRLARVHMALLTGAHPKIICGDSIAMQNGDSDLWSHVPKGGVDVLLTNPPFGVKIVAARPDVLRTFSVARKWVMDKRKKRLEPSNIVARSTPPQVLFIERCLTLVRPGGRLGLVVPESLLSNKSYQHVVEYLTRNADIQAVIGMPEALFKTSGKGGTHTKTCLLVAKKMTEAKRTSTAIFMAEAKWCGQDSRARVIPHNDLPEISQRLAAHHARKRFSPSHLGFLVNHSELREGVLCPRYYDPQAAEEIDGLKDSHDLMKFSDLLDQGILSMSTGDEIGKLAYGTGIIPFIRTSDISNWEIKADPKHGVSRDIYERLSAKQDVRPGDLLMVKDGTYLIGTCAIVTEADAEMLYQSHLYKIRVHPNDRGLNPYLLLALLSSTAVQKQIRSKQFTQDIIDSLGARIRELVLPVPKSEAMITNITDMVRRSVELRIEARQLAQQARRSLAS